MKKVRKLRVILLSLFVLFLLCVFFKNSLYFYLDLYEIKSNTSQIYLPREKRDFNINTLDLHSKCLCQKETVSIRKFSDYYHVSIVNKLDETKSSYTSYNITRDEFESYITTCDLYKVLRRGKHQKVLSYSMQLTKYEHLDNFVYLIKNIKQKASAYYPDWVVRIYYKSGEVDQNTVCEIECSRIGENQQMQHNVDFCDVNKMPLDLKTFSDVGYMITSFWRWLPIGDDFVSIFISRDTESCIFNREIAAVNEWLESKTLFHVMRGIHF